MGDEHRTTEEKPRAPFDCGPCAAWMEKLAGQQGERCSCFDVMARMASTCCGAQGKADEVSEEG